MTILNRKQTDTINNINRKSLRTLNKVLTTVVCVPLALFSVRTHAYAFKW